MNILHKFGMMETKHMMTLMITNLKKLRCSYISLMDPTCYKHLIVTLMYLVNIRPDICFAINVLSQF